MPYQQILLIDDDEDDQEIFVSALKKANVSAECTTFYDAREALDKLVARELSADLIFLDLNMPQMNGEQFLKELKKDQKLISIPVIVLSTSSHSGTIALTKDLGAKEFITKPDRFEDLIHILQSLLK